MLAFSVQHLALWKIIRAAADSIQHPPHFAGVKKLAKFIALDLNISEKDLLLHFHKTL